MKPEDAEEYTQALGQVVAGGWRQIALGERLGVPKALGLSVDEWVKQRLGGYVKLSIEERKPATRELDAEGYKQEQIAGILGVDQATVSRDLNYANALPEKRKPAQTEVPEPETYADAYSEPLDVLSNLAVTNEAREAALEKAKREEREAERQQRKRQPLITLPAGKFRLIYADPPWQYEHAKTESRAVENQYPTLALDAICEYRDKTGRPVSDLAADDSVLFLWTPAPKVDEACRVIKAWGFTYRTSAVWDKEVIGMGYYFRIQHEYLLVAARGSLPVPEPKNRPSFSIIRSRRQDHSEKPDAVYSVLENMYPHFKKLDRVELFARRERPGWTCWINDQCMISGSV